MSVDCERFVGRHHRRVLLISHMDVLRRVAWFYFMTTSCYHGIVSGFATGAREDRKDSGHVDD